MTIQDWLDWLQYAYLTGLYYPDYEGHINPVHDYGCW